jgi:hypothetical protein
VVEGRGGGGGVGGVELGGGEVFKIGGTAVSHKVLMGCDSHNKR